MFKKIVFATDLTHISAPATAYAVELGRRFDAEVVLVYAIEAVRPFADEPGDDFSSHYRRMAEQAAGRAADVLGHFESAGVRARLVTGVGKRWEVIVRSANEERADLVVLGSQSIREGEKVYIGSTSHQVFLMATVPVMVIKGAPED